MDNSALLKCVANSQFLEQYYLKMPFAGNGAAQDFEPLGNWSKLNRLLQDAQVDLLVASSRLAVHQGSRPRTESQARELLAAGYTLGFRHVQNDDADLGKLAAEFSQQFAAPVDIHLYCTPSHEAGFGWHYDAEEVFVVQTFGSKEWMLRKNTVNPWPLMETLPADMGYQREIMPLHRCLLRSGDWLYIPCGYWHSTRATQESISLSIGVASRSGMDFFEFLRRELLNDLRWRQRLPFVSTDPSTGDNNQRTEFRERLKELASDLAKRLSCQQLAIQYEAYINKESDAVGRPKDGTAVG